MDKFIVFDLGGVIVFTENPKILYRGNNLSGVDVSSIVLNDFKRKTPFILQKL